MVFNINANQKNECNFTFGKKLTPNGHKENLKELCHQKIQKYFKKNKLERIYQKLKESKSESIFNIEIDKQNKNSDHLKETRRINNREDENKENLDLDKLAKTSKKFNKDKKSTLDIITFGSSLK